MKRRDFGAMLLAAGAAGCDWFKDKKQPLSGERISVLGVGGGLEADPNLAATNTSAAEGIAVDKNGVIYGAEVGPKALKRYVKRK